MLLQYAWLSSLPIIASANAQAYPPVGLKPRYLATGTGVSLPSTSPPPYPTDTSTANGIATLTGSIVTSTATTTPIPPSDFFYLVVADTGTSYDGDYLSIGSDTSGASILVLYPGSEPSEVTSFSTFNINADGTLQNEFVGGIANIFTGSESGTLFFENEASVDESGNTKSICDDIGGTLNCQTGAATVFYICPPEVITGTLVGGTVDVGLTVEPGCTPVTLLVVPV